MQITEQDIRRLAIGRLRLYYKFRPRREWDGIQVIDKAHYYDGITIDARLTYVEPDGTRFIATVEATSLDKRAEVDYRHHWYRLLTESLALSLGTLCLALIVCWLRDFNVFYDFSWGLEWWFLPATLGLVWASWAAIMSTNYRRYRYIYAIAQFKRFHADDQWIAVDGSLYASHASTRFRELERQCIRYGFGLMEVEVDRSVRILIAPKRGDFFGEARRRELPQWVQRMESAPVLGNLVRTRMVEEVPKPVQTDPLLLDPLGLETSEPQQPVSEMRPTQSRSSRPQFVQRGLRWLIHLRWLLRALIRSAYPPALKRLPGYFSVAPRWNYGLFAGLIGASILLYQQASYSQLAVPNEASAAYPLDRLEGSAANPPPVDMEYEAELNEFNTRELEGFSIEEDLTRSSSSAADTLPDAAVLSGDSDVFFYHLGTAADTTILFNCLRLPKIDGSYFIIEYIRTATFDEALRSAMALHRRGGLEVNISRADCFRLGAPGYIVFLDEPSTDEGNTNFRFRRYTREFDLALSIVVI